MAYLLFNIHPSKAKLTLFLDRNCLEIACTVSEYSLRQMLLRVLADGDRSLVCNALYNHRTSKFDKAFQAIWAKTHLNIR